MFKILKFILLFIVINTLFNYVVSFHPALRYVVYAGLLIYFFRSFRLRMPRSRAGTYTYQEPNNPPPSNGDVIDVEYTEREEKSES